LIARPLWFDELFTLWAARQPTRDLVAALRLDSGPPGFYLLERPFARLADRASAADAWIRVPSLLASLALLLAARALSRGASRALFVVLVSGSTLLNLYAAEARPYALLAALLLALFLLALRGEERPSRLVAAAVVAALALYTHYLALFALAALLVLSAAARRWRSFAALLAGAAVFLPWAPVLRAQPAAAVAWIREPLARTAAGMLSSFGGVGRVPSPFQPRVTPALFVAGVLAGAACWVVLLLRSRRDRDARDSAAFVLLVLAGVAAAGFVRPIVFAGRTEMAVLPVFLWGLAAAPGSRGLRAAAIAGAALGLATTAATALHAHEESAPSAVAASLARAAREGDVVVASASFYLPARLAFERGRLAAPVRALPEELAAHPGWFVPTLPGPAEEIRLAAAMAEIVPGHRLFLVMPPPYQTDGLARALEGAGRVEPLLRTVDAVVLAWTRAD
jgi:mannosyltransferase